MQTIQGKNARQREIMASAGRTGEVSVADLAKRFGVSAMTVRRDLDALYRDGRLARIHGGAVPSRTAVAEFLFEKQTSEQLAQKQAIARAVCRLISPGMTIALDTGTTTLEVARALAGAVDLKVLTTSLAIAAALHTEPGIEVILLGGTMRRLSPDLCGPLAEDNLQRFHIDLAIIGADAVTAQGTFTGDTSIARTTRAMAARAGTLVLAATADKFTRTALYLCVGLEAFDHVVTTLPFPAGARRWLKRSGARVEYARAGRDGNRRDKG